jgi:transposase
MSTSTKSKYKVRTIRNNYLTKALTKVALSKRVGADIVTINKYYKEFEDLAVKYPEQAWNIDFFPAKPKKVFPPTKLVVEMAAVLPKLIADLTVNKASVPALFDAYKLACPDGFAYPTFRKRFARWHKTNNVCLFAHKKVNKLFEEDQDTLKEWLAGNDLLKWRHATVVTDSYNGIHFNKIAAKVQLTYQTILTYIAKYNEGGLTNLKRKYGRANDPLVVLREEKKVNLMKLIHQPPKLHGINRASWSLADLSKVYYDVYGVNVSTSAISLYFRQEGIGFLKARVMLTSPDPKYQQKLDHIKGILSNLSMNEKFFSIDEYGPFSIKMKPGWSYTKLDHPKIVKQFQKSKGWAICTAALELSTNQVTHFYSKRKDTDEMIRLIDVLVDQYQTDKKLYISWDAASWHNSNKLKEHLTLINSKADQTLNTTPYVELAPLPSTAQFLNVIESVFSGLARAIMHNSDYHSVEECKAAIDRYFADRNAHFIKYPKRAGKTIWGKEMVKPVFDEANNCKDPAHTLVRPKR